MACHISKFPRIRKSELSDSSFITRYIKNSFIPHILNLNIKYHNPGIISNTNIGNKHNHNHAANNNNNNNVNNVNNNITVYGMRI